MTKRFDDYLALAPTDLDAPAGKVTLVTGRNGAGKTTLIRILATLVLRDGGDVRINGLDPTSDGRLVRHQIGVALVNERSLFWRLTVAANLELFARIRGVPKSERRTHCIDVLAELGVDQFADRTAHALSAGQRQRVVLARALVGQPPVLLVDEPLRGLDEDAETLAMTAIQVRADAGATVVIATPSAAEFDSLRATAVTVGNAASAAELAETEGAT